MGKLTLSVDGSVVKRAKRYATRQGTSLSALVERYLRALCRPGPTDDEGLPPVTRRLKGVLKGARVGREDYLDYLRHKYR